MNHWDVFWKGATADDKRDFLISLLVIALAGIFILYYIFPKNDSGFFVGNEPSTRPIALLAESDSLVIDEVTYKKIEISDLPAVAAISTPIVGNSVISQDRDTTIVLDTIQQHESSVVPPISTPEDLPSSNDMPLHDTLDTNTESLLLTDTTSKTKMDTTNRIEKDTVVKKEPIIKEYDKENKEVPVVETPPATNKDCAILIGAYSDVKNATKMRLQLEKAGFDVFVTSNNTFTKIGVYSSCEPSLLNEKLKNIRTNFADDAVLLKQK